MDIDEWVKMVHGPNVTPSDIVHRHRFEQPPLSARHWLEEARRYVVDGDVERALHCLDKAAEEVDALEDQR